jgi:hypothetical protein
MEMTEKLWAFVDAAGAWMAKSYGFPAMTGRVLGWLLVCDPVEQTAAEIAEALGASSGSISGATGMLVRYKLVDRLRVRGERADRFRMRVDAWDEQIRDVTDLQRARDVLAQGLDALAGSPPSRLGRLQELDAFYAWWQSRAPALWEEWQDYKQANLKERFR